VIRILFDTNVILDRLLAREPFATEARDLWRACEDGRCVGYVAAIGLTTAWYIGRKQVGAAPARQQLIDLLTILRVAPVDGPVLETALAGPIADFEDGVQLAAAVATGLDVIVTRNGDDFFGSTIPILTPADALKKVNAPTDDG
jgi:predicted nucleic acid-binding protein